MSTTATPDICIYACVCVCMCIHICTYILGKNVSSLPQRPTEMKCHCDRAAALQLCTVQCTAAAAAAASQSPLSSHRTLQSYIQESGETFTRTTGRTGDCGSQRRSRTQHCDKWIFTRNPQDFFKCNCAR